MKLLPVVLGLVLVTGCSGGEDDAAVKAEFLKDAEAICTKANADQDALTFPSAPAQITPYVRGIVQIAERTTNELKALTPPAKDEDELEAKVFTPLEGQLSVGKAFADKVAAAARANNQAELTRLLTNPPTETKADLRWMKDYGFDACVEAADTSG